MNSRSGWHASAQVPKRNSCSVFIVAVILARKLAAECFEVSIGAPAGDRYPADKFSLLLTSKSLDSQEVAGDG